MKKKQVKTIIILFGTLAALILAFFLIRIISERISLEKSQKAEEESLANVVYLFDGEDITAMEINGIKFTFDSDQENWMYASDSEFPLDSAIIKNIASSFGKMSADKVFTEVDELQDYGLESPSNVVKLVNSDGSEFVFEIGNKTIDGTYYVMVNHDSNQIYCSTISYYSKLYSNIFDYAVIEDLSKLWEDCATEITLEEGEHVIQFTKQEIITEAETETTEDGETKTEETETKMIWNVSKDGASSYVATDETSISDMQSIIGFDLEAMIAYNVSKEQKTEYGMDNPKATITIVYDDEEGVSRTLTIWIGSANEDDSVAVMSSNSDEIYKISQSTADKLQTIFDETYLVEEETKE